MENKKTLTTNGLTVPHVIYILISLAMIGVSLYLTNHFYDTFFPKGFSSQSSLCEISTFWGCDKATTSFLGRIFNVPTSFFGIVIGVIGLLGAIFPSIEMEKTNKTIIYINALGCIGLLLFSLIKLGGLCPFCSVYYLLSFAAAYLFWKYSDLPLKPNGKILVLFSAFIIFPSIFMNNYFKTKESNQKSLSDQYVEQYKNLKDLGDPIMESQYKIHMSNDTFSESPIRISIFSDFECQFCKIVSTQIPSIINAFKQNVSIQYFFYPLDNACNKNMKGMMHKYACKAAELAACSKDKFAQIHDIIFERQEEINLDNLKLWEKEFELTNCYNNQETKDFIQQSIAAGEQYNLRSTPTIIINGKKIEGVVPTVHLKAILNSILE